MGNRIEEKVTIYNGIPGSFKEIEGDFICPVCFKIIEEAYVTRCGHSFCYTCIRQSLEIINRCPKCNCELKSRGDIFPNATVNELLARYKQADCLKAHCTEGGSKGGLLEKNLDLGHVEVLLGILKERKEELEYQTMVGQRKVILEFLKDLQSRKKEELQQVTWELNTILTDIESVQKSMSKDSCFESKDQMSIENSAYSAHTVKPGQWQKVCQRMSEFEESYFASKRNRWCDFATPTSMSQEEFSSTLSKFAKFTSFHTLATLQCNTDMYNVSPQSCIVSGIAFDKDSEYLAVAGVTKKIKIFDYNQVILDTVDLHCPVAEMCCASKVSCVAWSPGHKGTLANSDYNGIVNIWDVGTATKKWSYTEHRDCCWSIDFCHFDTTLLVSGSDDACVKIWSLNSDSSVATLPASANVSCVQFDPSNHFRIAYGCADHCIYYYDLRNPKQALAMLHGHCRSVSHIKFLGGGELVSASTDSQLKLWRLDGSQSPGCIRTFRGHVNVESFVGLATDGQYVACGSEDNSLRLFYKGFSHEVARFKFGVMRSPWNGDEVGGEEDGMGFVSSVAWKPSSNVVLAANSQGIVKILQLL